MNNTTVYIGMDVHKNSFSLCCYTIEDDKCSHHQKIDPDYRLILKYIESMRTIFGGDCRFVCGYEAECLGYSLYHQLNDHAVECVILAPSTMTKSPVQKKKKTDKRDSETIAKCLAFHTYHEVHIPTPEEEQIEDFIRMRDDHKQDLKKTKQRILQFCLRHNYIYTSGASYWTAKYLKWLHDLQPEGLNVETLQNCLVTYNRLVDTIERLDRRIEELAEEEPYRDKVKRLSCFIGVTHRLSRWA
jgi:transposase